MPKLNNKEIDENDRDEVLEDFVPIFKKREKSYNELKKDKENSLHKKREGKQCRRT